MIITYEKAEKYPCCVCIPEGTSWKLTAEIEEMTEDAACYALQLIAGEFQDTILSTDDGLGLVDTGDEAEDEAILAIFSQIIDAAAKKAVRAVHSNDVLDLAEIIRDEISFYIGFWKTANQEKQEADEE